MPLPDWRFHRDPAGFLLRIAREQGDIARFRLGAHGAVLLSHPDMIRAVLVDHADAFRKGNLMQRARRLLGDGLLTSEGDVHHAQRRRIQPAFTRTRVAAYASHVPDLVARMTDRWRPGEPVRIDEAMQHLAMAIVARSLLGTDVEREAPRIGAALERLSRWGPLLASPLGGVLERSRVPVIGGLRAAIELVESAIGARIAAGGADAPLLRHLLGDGSGMPAMSPTQVRDEVMTIFLAGHDTTAAGLTWAWLFLGHHPPATDWLHASLDAGDPSGAAAVASEVLRLVPPVGRIGRRTLREISLEGVTLAAGEAVFVSPYVTQRDPRWFARAGEFLPSRWTGGASPPAFAYFPFGAGPRSCIGEHLARRVMADVIATIGRRWILRPQRDRLPPLRSWLTLKPKGAVWLVPERRP